jgi:hypothetical protein
MLFFSQAQGVTGALAMALNKAFFLGELMLSLPLVAATLLKERG